MKDAYVVDILNKSIDPVLILGFAVAIDMMEH